MDLAYFLHLILLWINSGFDYQVPALQNSQNTNLKGYIRSPHLTNNCTWGKWAMCDTGDFVVGVSLRVELPQHEHDDSALNAIHVRCESPDQQKSYKINSQDGFWGDWTPHVRCPGNAIGFQLRSKRVQGGDGDSAAVDFQLLCLSKGKEIFVGKSGRIDWGSWTAVQRCPPDQAVCGIQTQVQDLQGISRDDSALYNVSMACCSTK